MLGAFYKCRKRFLCLLQKNANQMERFWNVHYIFFLIMNIGKETEMKPESPVMETTQESKQFVYSSFTVNYVNTSKVQYFRNEQDSEIKVNNFLCYQQGNTLYKVTEICYEDKVVRIEDKYTMNELDGKPDKNEIKVKFIKNKDKVRIFCQDQINKLELNGKVEKKDKKNIVKNLVKIFLAWVEKKKIEKGTHQFEQVEAEMKKLLTTQNFNNRLIKEMISNEMINKKFLHFLIDDADEEVKYSRINDKESHYEAIELYTKLLQNSCEEKGNKLEIKNEGKSTEKDEKFEEQDDKMQ